MKKEREERGRERGKNRLFRYFRFRSSLSPRLFFLFFVAVDVSDVAEQSVRQVEIAAAADDDDEKSVISVLLTSHSSRSNHLIR